MSSGRPRTRLFGLILLFALAAFLFAASISWGSTWIARFVRFVPQHLLWEAATVILCVPWVRLLLLWLKESHGRAPRGQSTHGDGLAVERLRKEIQMAQQSDYFRQRVYHRLREAAAMLSDDMWSSDQRLFSLMQRVSRTRTADRITKSEREHFLEDVAEVLKRLPVIRESTEAQ